MRALVVTVAEADSELAADLLWQMGVAAVEERGFDADSIELWTTVGDDDAAVERLAGTHPEWAWRTEPVDLEPVEAWRDHARPVVVADSVMTIPAWQEDAVVPNGVVPVRIEPAGSFGLGDHPTTRLALEHLVSEVAERPGCRIIDVGCGSGVLSIAGVLLGASEARAVDVSTAAVEAAHGNVERNGVGERVRVDDAPAALLAGDYDVVVANILAPVLVSLADDLRRLCAPGGRVIISGILEGRHDHVLAALEPLRPVRTTGLDGWAAVTLEG